jgi:hypothetical protein
MEPEVYHVHKGPPSDSALSQMNPDHLPMINFKITLPFRFPD